MLSLGFCSRPNGLLKPPNAIVRQNITRASHTGSARGKLGKEIRFPRKLTASDIAHWALSAG
jgi:hypothetical protein